MFTGIIKELGVVQKIEKEGSNIHITIEAEMTKELKIDESVAHNGVCLTVVAIDGNQYTVTAIEETMLKTNLGDWIVGTEVNLERAMVFNARLDGHIIQGHVDKTGTCTHIKEVDGSWYFTFEYEETEEHLVVDKGSICVNGTSLTVVDPAPNSFSVAIIPYTFEETVFRNMKVGDAVNLEFDILGKYIAKYAKLYAGKL
ncbi:MULTISPECIES: riboflavin synthase [unclassified Aureispira]|uniref:riboflavin synthase n=1 Tax=unclassified Aureispira TaxID=2649989 RepID=UPI0006978CB5|nr:MULTISPECIES: riboflavin synthase [unclassified Aureispira]WMX13351.1 riboflavin synthase [Aureispira sp. CCB-E]